MEKLEASERVRKNFIQRRHKMLKKWKQLTQGIEDKNRKHLAYMLNEWRKEDKNPYIINGMLKNLFVLEKYMEGSAKTSDSLGKDLKLFDNVVVKYMSDHCYSYNEQLLTYGRVTINEGKLVAGFVDNLCHFCYITLGKKTKNVFRALEEDVEDLKKLEEKADEPK